MNFKLATLLIATFAFTTITDAVPYDVVAVESIPYNLFADVQFFWLKCVCAFNSMDKIMSESKLEDFWHNLRVQMTAIVNVEWNNCRKLADTKQRRKCKTVVIGHGVQVITKFANEFIFDHKLNLDWIEKMKANITTECF